MLPFEERKQEECLLAAPRNSSGVQEVLVVIGGICNNKKLKEVDYYNSVKGIDKVGFHFRWLKIKGTYTAFLISVVLFSNNLK